MILRRILLVDDHALVRAGIRALLVAQDFADRCHCKMCIDGSYCVTRILDATGVAGQFAYCAPRSIEPVKQ